MIFTAADKSTYTCNWTGANPFYLGSPLLYHRAKILAWATVQDSSHRLYYRQSYGGNLQRLRGPIAYNSLNLLLNALTT